MLIDWFTVGAQALNFLILVWLMQRFLYKPILRAIDAREKKIAQELADADLKKGEALKERDEFRRKNAEFERQRADLLNQLNNEVETERFELLDEARKAAEALGAQRMEKLRNEACSLNQAIRRRTQEEVFAIARKVLADLAGASLEGQMVDVFVRHVRALGEREKEELKAAFKTAAEPAVIRSAFELPAPQRAQIEGVIHDLVSSEAPVRFETGPDLVSGIDLTANGRKISWNIAAYLLSLEKGISELLNVKNTPGKMATSKPEEPDSGTVNA